MSEPLRFLSPDEEEKPEVQLTRSSSPLAQPYGLISLLSGLTILLVLRATLPEWSFIRLLLLVILTGSIIYILLAMVQLRIRSIALPIVAAALGTLYSLPVNEVYWGANVQARQILVLLTWIIGSGIIGCMLGYALEVERAPFRVTAISFLTMFVMVHLIAILIPI